MSDATSELLRAVNFVNFEPAIETIKSRCWTSATFCGVRHEILFRLEGEGAVVAADAFADGLEEREFELRGHILADIALVSRSVADGPDGAVVRIGIEALTMEAV